MRGSTSLRRVRISSGSPENMSSWLIRASTAGAGPRSAPAEPDRRLDVAGGHRAALLQALVEAAQHLLGLLALRRRPVQREVVAAAVDRDAEARLDLDDVAVELAAKVDQEAVVGELQDSVGLILARGPVSGRGSGR